MRDIQHSTPNRPLFMSPHSGLRVPPIELMRDGWTKESQTEARQPCTYPSQSWFSLPHRSPRSVFILFWGYCNERHSNRPLPHSVRASIDFIDSRGPFTTALQTHSLFWVWCDAAPIPPCRMSIGKGEFRNPANVVRKCSSCRQKIVVLGQLFSLAPEIGLVLPFILTTKILLLAIELTKIHSLSSPPPLSQIDHHRFAAQRISRNYRTNKSRDPVFRLRVISDSNINMWWFEKGRSFVKT